jgi:hypothetical protein
MTAWEILLENSTIQVGTAWDHLNNQGGGEIKYIERISTIYGEQTVTLMADFEITVDSEDIDVSLDADLVVTLEDEFRVG